MKKAKRSAGITGVALGLAVMTLFSGCKSDPAAEGTSSKDPAEAVPSKGTNEFGWDVPSETLKFSIYNVIDNDAPTEEKKAGRENMKKYLLEHFNVDITLQTVDGDGNEALNLALAANNYPEVVTGVRYPMAQKFQQQGKAAELTPYMDTTGKDIKAAAKDTYPLLLDDEEKLWFIPTSMGALMDLPDNAAGIRLDEYQAIGSPPINTPDDYYAALKTIIEKTPTTPTGEKRFAMSLYDTQVIPEELTGYWGLKRGWLIGADDSFTYWAFTEEGKAMTKWFNQIYRDGLLDPDTFNNKFDDWKAKFSNERIAGCIGGWWISSNAGHEVWQTLDPNTPEDKRYIQVGFKAPEAEAAYLTGKNKYGGRSTIITDKAADPESILRFANFQATEKGLALFGWGIPNGTPTLADPNKSIKMWDIQPDGTWQFDPDAKQLFITEKWDYNGAYVLANDDDPKYMLFQTVDRWPDGEFCVWPNQCWYAENKWKSRMIDNLKGTIYDATPMTLRSMDDQTILAEQAIKDTWKQHFAISVQSADDAAFEANWKAFQDALKAAGIDAYSKTTEENYKKNVEKLSQYAE